MVVNFEIFFNNVVYMTVKRLEHRIRARERNKVIIIIIIIIIIKLSPVMKRSFIFSRVSHDVVYYAAC